jgi:hypothetical protein
MLDLAGAARPTIPLYDTAAMISSGATIAFLRIWRPA